MEDYKGAAGRETSTQDVTGKERFLELFESYMDDFIDNSPDAKVERVKNISSAVSDFKKLDEKMQKELLLTYDEVFQMPIIAMALVKHDMADEMSDILNVLPEDDQDIVLDTTGENDTTLLHVAMKSDSAKVVKYFLESGFVYDAPLRHDGGTPLSLAVDNGSFNAVEAFLSHLEEGDKNVKKNALNKCDENNNSALHIVATSDNLNKYEQKEMAQTLFEYMSYESVFDLKNDNGNTADKEALLAKNAELAADILSKKTNLLFKRLEYTILHAPVINKEIHKDNSRATEESQSSDRNPVNRDINKILRQGNKLEEHLQKHPEQVDNLDEILADDTVGHSKPGAGQRLRMKLGEYVVKLGIDHKKFEQLEALLTKGANRNLIQSDLASKPDQPLIGTKRLAEPSSQGFNSDRPFNELEDLDKQIDWTLLEGDSFEETLDVMSAIFNNPEGAGIPGPSNARREVNRDGRASAIDPRKFEEKSSGTRGPW